ncbi:MAG: hypothetical protein KDC24_00135 [Saprospiraceae bacterium]|nr:hypothetical protein [Saprospiraceae bacterium]
MISPEKPVIERILNGKNFNASKISMQKGSEIKKHYSATEALLVILNGSVEFHYPEATISLIAPISFSITPEKEHWLVALEDSTLILVK